MKKRISTRLLEKTDGGTGLEIVQYSGTKKIMIQLNERELEYVRKQLLQGCPNCVLLDEIEKHEDVKAFSVDPNDSYTVTASKTEKGKGPARILIVID